MRPMTITQDYTPMLAGSTSLHMEDIMDTTPWGIPNIQDLLTMGATQGCTPLHWGPRKTNL